MSATDPNIWNGMEWNRLAGIKTTWPKTNTFTFYGHCKLNFHKSDHDHRHRMVNTFMVAMVILVIAVIVVQLGNPRLPKCKSGLNKVRKVVCPFMEKCLLSIKQTHSLEGPFQMFR